MVNLGKITGPFLLLIPLILTVTIGVYFNNFNNNGFATPSVAAFNGCPTLILWNSQYKDNPEICQAYNSTYTGPCQSANNATFCGFQKPSVLNPNSLYTCILTVSWQCFINGITGANSGPTPQPYAFFNQPSPPIYNICLNVNASILGITSAGPATSIGYMNCDQVDQNDKQIPANQSIEYDSQYICYNLSPKIGYGGNYVYFGCNWNTNGMIYPVPPVNYTWSAIEAFNASEFGSGNSYTSCIETSGGAYKASCDILGSALIYTTNITDTKPAFDWGQCTLAYKANNASAYTISPACRAAYTAGQQENGASGSSLFFFGQILSLVGSIFLLLIGFGMGFSGGALTFNLSMTPNSQGTRYAQIIGFALLFIVPLDVEFSGPFTLLAIFGIGTTILALFAIFEVMGIFFMVAEPVGAG